MSTSGGFEWKTGKDPHTMSRKLNEFYDKLEQNLKTTAAALVEVGVQLAQREAPVDTGALRDSISGRVKSMMSAVVMRIEVGKSYGVYQEFGTVYHDAQPFLRPALKKLERVVVARTAKAYNDALYSVF